LVGGVSIQIAPAQIGFDCSPERLEVEVPQEGDVLFRVPETCPGRGKSVRLRMTCAGSDCTGTVAGDGVVAPFSSRIGFPAKLRPLSEVRSAMFKAITITPGVPRTIAVEGAALPDRALFVTARLGDFEGGTLAPPGESVEVPLGPEDAIVAQVRARRATGETCRLELAVRGKPIGEWVVRLGELVKVDCQKSGLACEGAATFRVDEPPGLRR
jgi:hypothetical protein